MLQGGMKKKKKLKQWQSKQKVWNLSNRFNVLSAEPTNNI